MRSEKIVIVDDDEETIQLSTAALMEVGFRNIEQYYEAELLFNDIEKELPIDLLIVDEKMAGMSGIELLSKLEKYKSSGMKMLLISGVPLSAYSEYSGEFLQKAFDFPVFMSDLKACVARLLG